MWWRCLGASVAHDSCACAAVLPVKRLVGRTLTVDADLLHAVFVLIGILERHRCVGHRGPWGLADLVGKDLFLSSLLLLVATALLRRGPNIPPGWRP